MKKTLLTFLVCAAAANSSSAQNWSVGAHDQRNPLSILNYLVEQHLRASAARVLSYLPLQLRDHAHAIDTSAPHQRALVPATLRKDRVVLAGSRIERVALHEDHPVVIPVDQRPPIAWKTGDR